MLVSTLVCLLVFLLNAQPTFSSIIINEVSPRTNPEWIELYNPDTNPVDLTGWYFKDASGTKKLITNSEPFSPNTYYLATGYTSWLNNTGSESLYLFNNSDIMIDSVSFEETKEDTVLARVPDIIGNWLLDQPPTPLAANIQPSPSPTPPPSPEPAPSVQSSPAPTPTPTPTPLPSTLASAQKPSPSPTPSPTQAHSASATSTPALSPSVSALVVDASSVVGTVAGLATIDLSGYENISSVSPSIKSESKDNGLTLNKSRAKNLIYIGSGLTLLSLAIYLWFRRKNEGIINR